MLKIVVSDLLKLFESTAAVGTIEVVTARVPPKIQQTKMLVTCKRFGDSFLFGLVWQYSSVQTKYNKGRFKIMATSFQQ